MAKVRKPGSAVTAVVFFALFLAISGRAQDALALRGTIATPTGFLDDATLVVENGTIRSIGKNAPPSAGTTVIDVGGIIFPGLIDLHNHLTWNIFPRWRLTRPVGNRYDWQALPEYVAQLSGPEYALVGKNLGCEMERYAEVKAMVGGATSVIGSFSPDVAVPPRNECDAGLARNLDFASGLYTTGVNAEPVRYNVFPLEVADADNQTVLKGLDTRTIKAYIVHLAEGADASAAREFKMFKARGLLHSGIVIIHGVALGEPEFSEMAGKGMGLVWSPRSNFELYGKTADIRAAKKARLALAIAPDWSPTGSFGSLAELQFAYHWNLQQTPRPLTDDELLAMVTSTPAKLAGVDDKIGSLAPKMLADFIVLRKSGSSPAMSVLDAPSGSVRLVVVGGRPLLGDPDLMKQLVPPRKLEIIASCGRQIALAITDDTDGESWAAISQKLTVALQQYNTPLAPLEECR
jgi:5-methylthioadenosine/S-adenosylhomocysteine deaminase